ncbi:MAG TPA: TonB-dependent receptor [Bacteroidales bacterium]|nr:TonB-dependent receptor [Bacteroidales bacterium]
MRKGIWIILTLLVSTKLYSQQPGAISGRITDQQTGLSLPGASVIYAPGRGTVSNSEGVFHLIVREGSLTIVVQHVGYTRESRQFNIQAGDSIVWNVSMEPEVTQIDQVIVSAGRMEQRIGEAVVSVSVIRPEEFSNAHINDPTELFNRTPGIEILDGQASIRGGSGFAYGAGSRVLALLDGLPMIAPDAGNIRWEALPLENISQIEIIKGASSVLYGSSALNGVINFRTAYAPRNGLTTFFVETGLFDRPQQANWHWWDNPRFFASYSASHLQRYANTEVAMGAFMLNDPGYRKRNDQLMGRLNFRIRHHNQNIQGLSYGISTNLLLNNKVDFLLWENAHTGALIHDTTTVTRLNARLLYIDPFISLKREQQFSHDLRFRYQHLSNQFPHGEQVDSEVNSLYAEYQFWKKLSDHINLNTGIVQQSSFVRSGFYGDHESLNLAAYAQTDVSPVERIQLVAGMRVEHNTLNDVSDKLILLLRGGVNFRIHNNTFIRGSFGQGYRYPSIAEKFAATTLGAVRIFPNPHLNPESGWNAELGIKRGIQTSNLDGLIDLALFYTQNKNMIEFVFGNHFDPLTGNFGLGFKADNTEYSRVYGLELEFRFDTNFGMFNYSINGGYVFTYPTEFNPHTLQNTGVLLKYRRKHSGRLNISATRLPFELNLNIIARSKILSIDDVFLNPMTREAILPGFYDYWNNNNRGHLLSDFSLGYHFGDNYTLSVAIKNLTNAEYMGRPGDIQPPRHFSLRFSGRF